MKNENKNIDKAFQEIEENFQKISEKINKN